MRTDERAGQQPAPAFLGAPWWRTVVREDSAVWVRVVALGVGWRADWDLFFVVDPGCSVVPVSLSVSMVVAPGADR